MPPPPVPQAIRRGRVYLTSSDLRRLARDAGLSRLVEGRALEAEARLLAAALEDYVLWIRLDCGGPSSAQIHTWADGLASAARLVVSFMAGACGRRLPREAGGEEALYRAWVHLTRAMPSTLLEREADVVSDLRLLLFKAGAAKTPAECSIGVDLRTAMGSSLSALAAVAIMGERLVAHTAEAPRRRGTDEARASLFLRLAAQFERMHPGQRFTVSNRYVPEARHGERDNVPAGPAFDWVRALFELAAGRAAEGPDGRPFRELADLARWAAETPDGLAKRIQRARARLRERQRKKPRRAFPRREPRGREPHRKKP